MNIKDKIVVVTGGGNGIGRELVLALLEKEATVAAIDLREESLRETQKLAGEKANKLSTHVLNISDKTAVEGLPEQIIAKHGAVDGIINNAGIIQPFVKVNELDYEAIERVMNVNFFGTLHMVKAFLPYLLQRPEAHIVNVSSMGGFLPVPGQSVYGASKAAVKLLTEALYAELADTSVRVTAVFPGAIGTNITANSNVEAPKIDTGKKKEYKTLSPKTAAQIIINGVEKNKFHVLVGSDAKMMDMLYRMAPKFATELIAKQMKSLLAK